MNAKAKTIKMLLYEGSLDGVLKIEDSKWNPGELFSAPKESVNDLLETEACSKYGVYLLLSSNMVYVGQASDLEKRMKQHMTGKEWWDSVIILTTKDDSFSRSDIDYLEYVLIEKARSLKTLDCDNKKKGNPPKVDDFRRVDLNQYLEEALFLIELIGIRVFKSPTGKKARQNKNTQVRISTKLVAPDTSEPRERIPSLPSEEMKIGQFVYTVMQNLSESGYTFSEECIDKMCTKEWTKEHFHTIQPFMRRYVPGVTDTKDENGNVRFRAKTLKFGNIEVYVSKEWYERQRNDFIRWYNDL